MSDFSIDELNLDKECIRQPELYYTWAKRLADAKQMLDEARADESVAVAETNKKIRSNPAKYDLPEKPTEASINVTVSLQTPVRDAAAAVIEATHKVNMAQAAVTAMEHKKRSLTLCVTLRGQEYWAEPSVPKDGKHAVEADAKRRTRTLGQRKPVPEGEDD